MRVCDAVMRAGGDEEFIVAGRVAGPPLAESMMIERKSAFEAAGDPGMGALPRAPLGEWRNLRQVVASRQFVEKQIGEWRGGFSYDKAGMPVPLQQHDGPPE